MSETIQFTGTREEFLAKAREMMTEEKKPVWDDIKKLAYDLEECARDGATYEAVDVIMEALGLLMKQLDQDAKGATNRGLDRLSEIVEVSALAKDAVSVLSDVVTALREDAPGTKLNNHKYDQLGIRANSVIERSRAALQTPHKAKTLI